MFVVTTHEIIQITELDPNHNFNVTGLPYSILHEGEDK